MADHTFSLYIFFFVCSIWPFYVLLFNTGEAVWPDSESFTIADPESFTIAKVLAIHNCFMF